MPRLIDRIKDTLQDTSDEQSHDHESGGAHGLADEQAKAAEHEHRGEHGYTKKGHKHC
jgi:hypothetical protein